MSSIKGTPPELQPDRLRSYTDRPATPASSRTDNTFALRLDEAASLQALFATQESFAPPVKDEVVASDAAALRARLDSAFTSGVTENVLDENYKSGKPWQFDGAYMENAARTYGAIRRQIDHRHVDNGETRGEYQAALNETFRNHLEDRGQVFTRSVQFHHEIAKGVSSGILNTTADPATWSDPLAQHPELNLAAFGDNLAEKSRQFADSIIADWEAQGTEGAIRSAREKLAAIPSTSVNRLSYSDLTTIMDALFLPGSTLTRADRLEELAGSSGLSELARGIYRQTAA